jgi:hypothetical protein
VTGPDYRALRPRKFYPLALTPNSSIPGKSFLSSDFPLLNGPLPLFIIIFNPTFHFHLSRRDDYFDASSLYLIVRLVRRPFISSFNLSAQFSFLLFFFSASTGNTEVFPPIVACPK